MSRSKRSGPCLIPVAIGFVVFIMGTAGWAQEAPDFGAGYRYLPAPLDAPIPYPNLGARSNLLPPSSNGGRRININPSRPRIGHEVVTGFAQGDPDRALVTGGAYNHR